MAQSLKLLKVIDISLAYFDTFWMMTKIYLGIVLMVYFRMMTTDIFKHLYFGRILS